MFQLSPDEWTAVELSLRVSIVATTFALPFGIAIGWLLARQAEIALAALDGEGADRLSAADKAFYQGKLATARFFAQTVLPRLSVER